MTEEQTSQCALEWDGARDLSTHPGLVIYLAFEKITQHKSARNAPKPKHAAGWRAPLFKDGAADCEENDKTDEQCVITLHPR
jgi:hypothetical protein